MNTYLDHTEGSAERVGQEQKIFFFGHHILDEDHTQEVELFAEATGASPVDPPIRRGGERPRSRAPAAHGY